MPVPRTSLSHPLRIDAWRDVRSGGTIGITFCPGKKNASLYGPAWDRDLALDLAVVGGWKPDAVVTLIETHEFELLQVPGLGGGIRGMGIEWHHWPIVDVQPPGTEFEAAWLKDGPAVVDRLRKGGRVLVHCRGGLGRAGTVASLLAVELGHAPEDALRQIRAVRPGAVETRAQEGYVLGYLRRAEPGWRS